jgi:predicted transposase/invertase (TIGR01784 family)
MKRDSLFYRIFQQSPTLLFDLLDSRPDNAADYAFNSIEVKETSFRIDGVFLPPDSSGIVYFVEVQFQPDPLLYERMMSESALYFYRYRQSCVDYRLVAIYPSESLEQQELRPHQFLLDSGKLTRVYLDQLGDVSELPIGLSLMVLTILEDDEAKQVARALVDRSQGAPNNRAIMDTISTILLYKFTSLSRDEVNEMLASTIEESLAYRQIKAEGLEEGRQEGRQEGRAVGKREMVLRQLGRRLKSELPEGVIKRIEGLSIDRLDQLAEALLDFAVLADLMTWLDEPVDGANQG